MRRLLVLLLLFAQAVFAELPAQRVEDADLRSLITAQSPTLWLDSSQPGVESGPQRHFRLNETSGTTLTDLTGGVTATASADVSGWTAAGKISNSLNFNGTSHYVTGDSDYISTGADSVAFWLYPNDLVAGGTGYDKIIDNGSFRLVMDVDYDRVWLTCNNSGASYSTDNSLTAAVWQHVCVTRDGNGNANFYINGINVNGADTTCSPPIAGSGSVFFGSEPGGATGFLLGKLDDVRTYNYVLSARQCADLAAGHEKEGTKAFGHNIVYDYSGSNIYAWQGHNTISFRNAVDANQPVLSLLNGRKSVYFNTNDTLATAATADSFWSVKNKTTFLVGSTVDVSGATNQYIFRTQSGDYYGMKVASSTFYHLNYDGSVDNPTIAVTNGPHVWSGTHDGTFLTLRQDGAWATTYKESDDTTNLAQTLYLGDSSAGTGYWTGYMGEFIGFNTTLSLPVIQQIEKGLSRKWGINLVGAPTQPSCDSFFASKTPTLWLRAADLSTITKDGSNRVSSWCSRVGSVCFTQSTDANKPVWTSSGVDFDGAASPNNDQLNSTATIDTIANNNAKTFLVVAKLVTGTNLYLLHAQNSGNVIYTSAANTFTLYNNDGAADVISGTIADNTTFIWSGTHDGVNLNATVNSTASSSVASGNSSDMTGALTLGSRNTGANPLDGLIMEVLADDSVWTADELAFGRSCLSTYGVTF